MLSRVIVAAVKSTAGGKAVRRCGVCRDVAKSFHFGGLACDSCKAFFRRSVQNEAFRAFRCAFRARCDITVSSRKCCQHCRFQKCLRIGMEIGWVMTEEERTDMLRSRMEKKQRSSGCGDVADCSRGTDDGHPAKRRRTAAQARLTDPGNHDREVEALRPDSCGPRPQRPRSPSEEIEDLVQVFQFWFKPSDRQHLSRKTSSEGEGGGGGRPGWLLVLLFVANVQKLVRFARGVGRFSALSSKDQMGLLRANALEMFLALHFHRRGSRPPTPDAAEEPCPFLASVDEGPSFGRRFAALVRDAPTLALLLMVVLFCPDAAAVSDPRSAADVEACRAHFCGLLQAHLAEKGAALFPRILLLLPTLREMRDKHLSYHFDVGHEDHDVAACCSP